MKTLDITSFDVTRLDDAELADAMATVRRLAEEEGSTPEAVKEVEAAAARVVDGFVLAYFRMASLLGDERAHNFASQFLQRDDLKPPPRPRGKAVDPQLDAHLVAAYEAAPKGERWAAVSSAMPNAKPKTVDAAVRRVQRHIEAREARRAILETQRQVVEVIRDWDAIRMDVAGKGDKK
jgi:hypothetical protein